MVYQVRREEAAETSGQAFIRIGGMKEKKDVIQIRMNGQRLKYSLVIYQGMQKAI